MFEGRFLATLILSMLGAGCAASASTTVAAQTPTVETPAKPSASAPAVTTELALAPSDVLAACDGTAIAGGIEHLDLLSSTRKMDGEEVAKTPSDADRNKQWKARFKTIADVQTLDECKGLAKSLAGELGYRYAKARTLCDKRDGQGAGDQFKNATGASLASASQKLKEAAEQKALNQCKQGVAGAEAELLALVDTANDACSPRERDGEVLLAAKVVNFCGGKQDAKLDAADAPRMRALNAPEADARDFGVRASGGSARGALSGGGLQSAILTGAADFFVERAEQEMSLFAVEVVGSELCAEKSPVLELLPRTCEVIGPEREEPKPAEPKPGEQKESDAPETVLGPTPGAIRAAAKADLEALPEKVATKIAAKDAKLGCAAAFGWIVADEVGHGADLATLLKDPGPLLEREPATKPCADSKEELVRLGEHLKRLLSGAPELVADQLRAGNFERLVSIGRALTPSAGGAADIGAELVGADKILAEVLRRLVELDRAIAAYHADPKPEKRVLMVIAALQTVEPILSFVTRGTKYPNDVRTSIDFFAQILNRQYAEAVVTASSLGVVQVLPRNTRNLVGLAAGLAQADSSDDVRKTIEEAALPLGSWRRKNVKRFGITLTGMVGGYTGYEFVTEEPSASTYVTNGMTIAPTLLVGADLHCGLGGSRFGLHFNVLDLGALASIRLDDPKVKDNDTDQTDETVDAQPTPEVEIEQVFAPGLFAYFGWGPFTAGPMATFVPSLRPYKDASGEIKPLSVVRVGAVLAVDVSVLPLL